MDNTNQHDDAPRCGLCGKREALVRTPCCNMWICDDAKKHIPFSAKRYSCFRNHERFTLCAFHHAEKHVGDWRTCTMCRNSFKTEIFVYFGTNDYNFVKLENPPPFSPTLCSKCGRRIDLGEEAYTFDGNEILCEECGPQFD